ARTMVQRASADTASPYAISEPGRGALVDVQFVITAVDNTAGIWNGPNSIPVVRTTATYAFQPLMGLIPATGLTLRLSHVERHIDE
ncbi:MAG: hypothetical protein K2Q10_11885, partial [Rhodospirillales bacterium]|nr:hypothetical protein [Rhodospirillales bacterium]